MTHDIDAVPTALYADTIRQVFLKKLHLTPLKNNS